MNILITGHTKGIGHQLLQQLIGANQITGIARSTLPQQENLIQIPADLSTTEGIIFVCEQIKQQTFDIIILNAGYNDIRPAESYSVTEIMAICNVNFVAPASIIKTCLPRLVSTQGWIFAMGSYSGLDVARWNNYYGASKAALHHLQKNIFEQYRKQGVRVTTIIPDISNTSFYDHQQFKPTTDEDTFINPLEIANTIADLINNKTSYVPLELVFRPQKFGLQKK